MKEIVVFNGIHGAGKTTLAEALIASSPDLFEFFFEIGGRLRQEVSYNALIKREEFDSLVMKRELARDEALLICPRIPVVETWHIGNLAYAQVRSPQMVDGYRQALERQMKSFRPFAFLVTIRRETFLGRVTERVAPEQIEQLAEFYRCVEENTLSIYHSLGIPYTKVTNDGDLGLALQAVKSHATSVAKMTV